MVISYFVSSLIHRPIAPRTGDDTRATRVRCVIYLTPRDSGPAGPKAVTDFPSGTAPGACSYDVVNANEIDVFF
jgi:hypothetical protein